MHGLVLDLAGVDDAPLALDAKGDLAMRQRGAVAPRYPASFAATAMVTMVASG